MASPARKRNPDIEPDIRPKFGVIQGGGETSEPTGNLQEVDPAPELNKREQFGVIQGGGESTPDRGNLQAVADDKEKNPDEIPFTGDGAANPQGIKGRISGFLRNKKKSGALFGILGGTGIIGILFSLFGPISMVISLTENLQDTNNGAQSAFERRITKVLGLKLQDTDGLCDTRKVKCKMGRISTKSLKKLEKKGVVAYDSEGKKLSDSKGKYPDKKISQYRVQGIDDPIPAGQMKQHLANDSKLAAKVLGRAGAFNVRFEVWRGEYLRKNFYERWKIGRNGGIADGENRKNSKVTELLEKLKSKLPSTEGLTEDAKAKVRAKADKMVNRGKKGGVAYLSAVGGCMGVKAPGMVANGVAAVQLARLMPLISEVVLSPGGKNKAAMLSNISSEDLEAVGKLLTATDEKGKSATDSKILQSAIGVNTNKTGVSKDFSPGYSILTNPTMRSLKKAEGASESTCNSVLSPQAMYTAAAVNSAITVAASATIIGGLIKVAAEWAISEAVVHIAQKAFEGITGKLISELAQNDELDKVLGGKPGEKMGDALGIAAMAFFSSGAAAQHIPVLKQSQLTAYNDIQTEQAIAQRTRDLASLSPFDITSKYTFLGSMVNNMNMAIVANGSAINYTTASLSYLVSTPLKVLSPATYAASEGKSKNYCEYAKDFEMQADSGMTPAVNAAGLPCYGYTGNLPTESAVAIATGNNEKNERWVKDDVSEEADLDEIVEDDTRLDAYLEGCGAASIENGEWADTAGGCTIDTNTNTSENAAGVKICTEDQTPEADNCFRNTAGIGETTFNSSTAQESEAVAAFAIDYQLSQKVDGFDEEKNTTEVNGGVGADFTAASYNFCAENIHSCPGGEGKANSIASVVNAKEGQTVSPFDIIGAQEVSRPTQTNLKTALPGYDSFPAQVEEHNGVAIFWNTAKFTKVGEGYVKNINGNGGTKKDHPWVQLKAASGQIVYYLSSHSPNDAFGNTEGRLQNARAYLNWAKSVATDDNLVVITGDFNSTGRSDHGKPSAYCVLTTSGIMQNAVDRVKTGNANISTPCPTAKGVQIDQIYNSTNISTLTAKNFGRADGGEAITGTDHNPVYVTYSIPAPAASTGGAGGSVDGDDYAECSKYLKSGFYCPGQEYSYQCTAFVNFRLAKHGVIKPTDIVGGSGGKVVGTLTGEFGFEKITTPQVNSVFSAPNSTGDGHTGMVSKVNPDGSIVVEEYNFSKPRKYGTRTLTKEKYANFTFANTGVKYK